jgi:hypothetical protein
MFLSTKKKSYDGMNDIPYATIAGEVHKRKRGIHGIVKRITSVLLK